MVALYFAAFAFSVLLLILTLAATSQYRGNYHVLSTMTTAIVNFGYWQLAMSHNLEEALLANRIAYLDGTFLTLIYVPCGCPVLPDQGSGLYGHCHVHCRICGSGACLYRRLQHHLLQQCLHCPASWRHLPHYTGRTGTHSLYLSDCCLCPH